MITWEGCGSADKQDLQSPPPIFDKIQTMIRMKMTLKRTMRLLMMMIHYGDDYVDQGVMVMKMMT